MTHLERLRLQIELRGYTPCSLAKKLKVQPQVIYRHLSGDTDMRVNTARKLIKLLNKEISFDDIYKY